MCHDTDFSRNRMRRPVNDRADVAGRAPERARRRSSRQRSAQAKFATKRIQRCDCADALRVPDSAETSAARCTPARGAPGDVHDVRGLPCVLANVHVAHRKRSMHDKFTHCLRPLNEYRARVDAPSANQTRHPTHAIGAGLSGESPGARRKGSPIGPWGRDTGGQRVLGDLHQGVERVDVVHGQLGQAYDGRPGRRPGSGPG